jgi:hypothetical protein
MAQIGTRRGDEALIAALAAGTTIGDAAQAAGLSRRTVARRLEEDEFRALVATARAEMFGRAVGILAEAAAGAAQTLHDLAVSGGSETVRLGAAKVILDAGHRARGDEEFEQRLSRVEASIHETGTSAGGG